METTETQVLLKRVPGAVKEALQAEAERERRSVNAQVIRILEERYGFIEDSEKAPNSNQEADAA